MVDSRVSSYDHVAAQYDRGRPDYPTALVDAITDRLGLDASSMILDLAAGTGKLTRPLAIRSPRVVAAEPVKGMRDVLRQVLPQVRIVAGLAENLPFADKCFDAVTVAQAYHWFEPWRAAREIRRVTRAGGGIAIAWNRRDLTDEIQARIDSIVRPYKPQCSEQNGWDAWKGPLRMVCRSFEGHEFRHFQSVPVDVAIDRVMSFSYIASLSDDNRSRIGTQLSTAVGPRKVVKLQYTAYLYIVSLA